MENLEKVLETGSITYYGKYRKVPYDYVGRRVWQDLKVRSYS